MLDFVSSPLENKITLIATPRTTEIRAETKQRFPSDGKYDFYQAK